jgi:hypothetical protein
LLQFQQAVQAQHLQSVGFDVEQPKVYEAEPLAL